MWVRGMEENKFRKCQWALRVKMLARSQIGITLLYSKLLEVLVKKHFIKMFLKAHSRGFEDTGQFFWGQTEKEFISISKIWSCLAQGGDLNEVRSLTARNMLGYGYDLRPQGKAPQSAEASWSLNLGKIYKRMEKAMETCRNPKLVKKTFIDGSNSIYLYRVEISVSKDNIKTD